MLIIGVSKSVAQKFFGEKWYGKPISDAANIFISSGIFDLLHDRFKYLKDEQSKQMVDSTTDKAWFDRFAELWRDFDHTFNLIITFLAQLSDLKQDLIDATPLVTRKTHPKYNPSIYQTIYIYISNMVKQLNLATLKQRPRH